MKKQLLSIIALLLCASMLFIFAACGSKNNPAASTGSESDSGESSLESGTSELDVGIPDADPETAEDVFATMKKDYETTMAYKGAYSVDVKWTENQTDTETGKGGGTTSSKFVTTGNYNADPDAVKSSASSVNEEYENGKILSTNKNTAKIYTENGKTYLFVESLENGESHGSAYNTLSGNTLANEKSAMLLSSFITDSGDFAECFGDPFSASSSSDLKSVHTAVLNEIKANQKARYEAEGFKVKQMNATANIIFNKTSDTNLFKRTITVTTSLESEGGTINENITTESLLKSKGGKLLSFVSSSTRSKLENLGESYNSETNTTTEISYSFEYALNSTEYNEIKVQTPASVEPKPDYFEVPLTFVISDNEVPTTVIGEATAENSYSTILEAKISNLFADSNIEYDGKWYTDAACTKEFDVSSVKSLDALKAIGKLYNKSFKTNGNCALFIDSGKATLNIPKTYTVVFGNVLSESILDTQVYTVDKSTDETANTTRINYEENTGHTITLALKNLNGTITIDKADIQEESTGIFFYEFIFEGGQIYFVQRTNVATKTYFTLEMFSLSGF